VLYPGYSTVMYRVATCNPNSIAKINSTRAKIIARITPGSRLVFSEIKSNFGIFFAYLFNA